MIFGAHAPGVLPISIPGTPALRQQRSWFVEVWEKRRDLFASADLWRDCLGRKWPLDASTLSALLDRPGQSKHFVVRHTMTNELLGLAVTYTIMSGPNEMIGSLALLIVKPTHRYVVLRISYSCRSIFKTDCYIAEIWGLDYLCTTWRSDIYQNSQG